jgi:hypothetical protein
VDSDLHELTEQVRAALIGAGLAAYEEAGMRGLCAEGAWEVAVGAMRSFDLSHVVSRTLPDPG